MDIPASAKEISGMDKCPPQRQLDGEELHQESGKCDDFQGQNSIVDSEAAESPESYAVGRMCMLQVDRLLGDLVFVPHDISRGIIMIVLQRRPWRNNRRYL